MKYTAQTMAIKYYSLTDASAEKYLSYLYSSDSSQVKEAVCFLKNVCIGSSKEGMMAFMPRFMEILTSFDDSDLLYSVLVCVNSLCKVTHSAEAVPVVVQLLNSKEISPQVTTMALKTLRTLSIHSDLSEYSGVLVGYLRDNQESVCIILSNCSSVTSTIDLDVVISLLQSDNYRLRVAALKLLLAMQTEDQTWMAVSLPDILTRLMSQEEPLELQLLSSSLMAKLVEKKLLCPEDTRVTRLISCLLRCMAVSALRKQACQSLCVILDSSCMTISQIPLAMSMIPSTALFLKESPSCVCQVFASLASSDTLLAKKILETTSVLEYITRLESLDLLSLKCLHALSRSCIVSHDCVSPLVKTVKTGEQEAVMLASSTLVNVVANLDNFERTDLHDLIGVFKSLLDNSFTRVHGITGLMNMLFKSSDVQVRLAILEQLGVEEIKSLLKDKEEEVVMKTLGFLRNLFKSSHSVMPGVMDCVLESMSYNAKRTEEAFCVFANIADSDKSCFDDHILEAVKQTLLTNQDCSTLLAATLIVSNLVWNDDNGDWKTRLRIMGIEEALKNLLDTTDTQLFDKVKTTLEHFRR